MAQGVKPMAQGAKPMAQGQGAKPMAQGQGAKSMAQGLGPRPMAKSFVKPMGSVPDPDAEWEPQFDEENSRFVIQLYDGDCELLFEIKDTEPVKTITLMSTSIPEIARGQGIGNKLAKSAFDYAVDNKMDVVIKCAFLAQYYMNHRNKYSRKLRVTGRYHKPEEEIDKNF